MKRFFYTADIIKAEGSQTFFVDAQSREEADDAAAEGGLDISDQEVDVTSLGPLIYAYETDVPAKATIAQAHIDWSAVDRLKVGNPYQDALKDLVEQITSGPGPYDLEPAIRLLESEDGQKQ